MFPVKTIVLMSKNMLPVNTVVVGEQRHAPCKNCGCW